MEEGDFVLWNGILCVKGAYACPAQLTSMTYFSLPGELGRFLNLKWQWKNISSLTSYLKYIPEAGLLCNREVFAKGWYFNSCSLKPLDSRERFARIKDHLCKTGSISVVKIGEDILLVTPDTQMTEDLGLVQDDQCLHCIVLSRQSRVAAAPKCETMSDEVFLGTPHSSSLLTNDSLQHVFPVRNEDPSSVTSYGDGFHHNRMKKSSSDDKRVAQSIDEHPERKRHKSEHSPCVTGSSDTPGTPITKYDKLKSKKKRHRSETPRKKGINMSPTVKIVTDETIWLQSHDKHSSDSTKTSELSSSIKVKEEKHAKAGKCSVREKENVKYSFTGRADDEKPKDKDHVKKQYIEGGLIHDHDKKKAKVVTSEKKSDKSEKSREKENSSKKHMKSKVSKLTVLEKKQLESEKVLSQLNLSHTKQDFSSLGRIPKKKPKEKGQSSDKVQIDSETKSDKKKGNSSTKDRKSSSEKTKESEKRRKTEKEMPFRDKEGKISTGKDCKHELDVSAESELTYERDNMGYDLLKLKHDPAGEETPFSLAKEECFQSIKDDFYAFTDQKHKSGGSGIPGLGDLDKLRLIELKERNLKVKRCIKKTEDGLLVKINESQKGLELWNNVDCFTGFVKQSLHRVTKLDTCVTDNNAFQQLWADKIHDDSSPTKDKRKATVEKCNPYDIRIQLQLSSDSLKSNKITSESRPSDIHIKLQSQDGINHASEETNQNADLFKSKNNTSNFEDEKDTVSRKIDKICKGEQAELLNNNDKADKNVFDKKLDYADIPEKDIEDKNEADKPTKCSIQTQESLKPDLHPSRESVDLNGDMKSILPLPKQISLSIDSSKHLMKKDLVKITTLNEDLKDIQQENTEPLKKADEKSKCLKSDPEDITNLKDIKKRTERRSSVERSRHSSGSSTSTKSNSNTLLSLLDVKTDSVSTGCELSGKREGSLHQRLGKIADMSVPADKKSKKSDKRQERQFHPYRKEDRPKRSNVPTWSFDIAYNDMEELLQNMTENVFKAECRKPTDVRKWRKGSCRTSRGSVKGRFYGHRFTRSKVPDSLPNYSEAREEEYDINPELISNMEERARQADIVEESWQNVPKEETSFIEEMCIYGQEKEEIKAKSNKEESTSVLRTVKPDVSLVIPGMGKTSLYSGEDLSDIEETKDEFLQGNSGEREKLEAVLSPKREKKTAEKEKKGSDVISMKKSSSKKWHERMICLESDNYQLNDNNSNKTLSNKNELVDSDAPCDLKTVDGIVKTLDKERVRDDKYKVMEENNQVVIEICTSDEEKLPSAGHNKRTKSSGDRELRILSSESDICLDWSDEDIVKEEAESDHDDDTFVVIDTAVDCEPDTPENKKETKLSCESNTPEDSQNDARLDYKSPIAENKMDTTIIVISDGSDIEILTDNGQHCHEIQEDITEGCGSLSPKTSDSFKENNQKSENNDVLLASIDNTSYSCKNGLEFSKKLVPYLCDSDGDDSEDEYNSDHYNTVDEVTDCDNPNAHSGSEEALTSSMRKGSDSSSKLSHSIESDGNDTGEVYKTDDHHSNNEDTTCDNSNVLNHEKADNKNSIDLPQVVKIHDSNNEDTTCDNSNVLNHEKADNKSSIDSPQVFIVKEDSQIHSTINAIENPIEEVKLSCDTKSKVSIENKNSGSNGTLDAALQIDIEKDVLGNPKTGVKFNPKNDVTPFLITEDYFDNQHLTHKLHSTDGQLNTNSISTSTGNDKNTTIVQPKPFAEIVLDIRSENDYTKEQEELHIIPPITKVCPSQFGEPIQANAEETLVTDLALIEEKVQLTDIIPHQNDNLEAKEPQKEKLSEKDFSKTKVEVDKPCVVEKDGSSSNPTILDYKRNIMITNETRFMPTLGKEMIQDFSKCITNLSNSLPTEISSSILSADNNSVENDIKNIKLSVMDIERDETVIDSESKENISVKSRDDKNVKTGDSFASLIARCAQNRKKMELIDRGNENKLKTYDKTKNQNQDPSESYLENINAANKDNIEHIGEVKTVPTKSFSSNEADFESNDTVLNDCTPEIEMSNQISHPIALVNEESNERAMSKLDLEYKEFEMSLGLCNKDKQIIHDEEYSTINKLEEDDNGQDLSDSQLDLAKDNYMKQDNERNENSGNMNDRLANIAQSQIEDLEITSTQEVSTDDDPKIISEPNILQETISSDLEQNSNGETHLTALDEYNSDLSKSVTDSEKQYTIKIKPIGNPDRFESPKFNDNNDQINVVTNEPTTFPKPSQSWEFLYLDSTSKNNNKNSSKSSYNISDLLNINLSTLAAKVKKKKKFKNKPRSNSLSLIDPNSMSSDINAGFNSTLSTNPSYTCTSTNQTCTQSRAILSSTTLSLSPSSTTTNTEPNVTNTSVALSATNVSTCKSTCPSVTLACNTLSHTSMNVTSATTVNTPSNTTSSPLSSSAIITTSPTALSGSTLHVSPISPASSGATSSSLGTLSAITNQSLYNYHHYTAAEWPMVGPYSPYPGYGLYPTSPSADMNIIGPFSLSLQNLQSPPYYNYPLQDYNMWYSNFNNHAQQQWYSPLYPRLPFPPSSPGNRRGTPRPGSRMRNYWNTY